MQPNTATKLKERKRAAVKDYVAVAGVFGVTHLLLFSRTEKGIKLRDCSLAKWSSRSFSSCELYSVSTN